MRDRKKRKEERSEKKKKSTSVCQRATPLLCALQARHYTASQMIGLLKTTGHAAKLQSQPTAPE